jgi:hypothetical protein
MYAIGGSASPTINSQGNRYIAPANPNAKEVRVSVLLCRVSGGSLSRFLPPAMFLGLGFALFFALLCFAWQVSVWSFGCKYVYRTRGGCQSAVAILLPKKAEAIYSPFCPKIFSAFFLGPSSNSNTVHGCRWSCETCTVSLIGDCPWYFLVPDFCFYKSCISIGLPGFGSSQCQGWHPRLVPVAANAEDTTTPADSTTPDCE